MKLLDRLFPKIQQVELVNTPIRKKVLPFPFLGYTFAPDKIVAVTSVVAENTGAQGAEPAIRYVFRVILAEKVMIAFHETDKATTDKKRELFIQEWYAAL